VPGLNARTSGRFTGNAARPATAPGTDTFFYLNAICGFMTSENRKRILEEEERVESAEYLRTPDGRNVTRKVSREPERTEETR
jgi:hypothetical protein